MSGTEDKSEAVPVKEMVEEVLAAFAVPAKEKNITLDQKISYPGNIHVQPELFKQVLKNLVSNAIKFSYPNSRVRVKVERKDGTIVMEVNDSGIGFGPKVGDQLFDRFTKKGRKGTSGNPVPEQACSFPARSSTVIRSASGHQRRPGKGSIFTISMYQ